MTGESNKGVQTITHLFQRQSKPAPSQQPLRDVRQDKGVLTNAPEASRQPAPQVQQSRARLLHKNIYRINKLDNTKVKLVHTTLHLHPLVRAELERIAKQECLSLSKVGADALSEWVRLKLHKQHEALLYPIIRQIIREELQAFGNRIVFFLMRIAFAAEQSRILITNVLDRMLRNDGSPVERFHRLVDQSNKLARKNIITKTPQIKTLIEEWKHASWQTEETRGMMVKE